MPSTKTINDVAKVAELYNKLQPLLSVGQITGEPTLSIANDVLQEIIFSSNWKWNRNEMTMFVTQQYKQDYLFAGATAFVIPNSTNAIAPNCGGVGIDLASNNAITESGTTVTVNCLETHPFQVGQTAYIIGTGSAYDSNYTVNSDGTFSGGWTITAVSSTSFQFTHTSSGLAASGAPGITDFGWLESGSVKYIQDNAQPQRIQYATVVRTLPLYSGPDIPNKFAVMKDFGTGVLKIRCYPLPTNYIVGVNLDYQQKVSLITDITQTWAPIPDELAVVYSQGFLANAFRFVDKATYQQEYQKFQLLLQKAKAEQDFEQSSTGVSPSISIFR
jgi:hypothetical protein